MFQGNKKTKMLSKLYLLNLDRPLPPWKLPKPSMLMELCLVTAPNNPMGDRHIRRHYTRESRHGYASQNIAGRKVGPQSIAIQCSLFLLFTATRIRGVYGRSTVKTFSCPLVSVLFTLEPGLQFSGIRNFDSCSQCTSTTSRCRDRFRMLQKVGNSFLPRLTWTHLRLLVGASDVSVLSRRRFNFRLNIILSLMFSTMTWRIHLTRLQLQLAELRITGNTIQNMAWLFVNTSSQGATFAARLTVLPKRLGWVGRDIQSAVHVLTKTVLLNNIGISMKTMIRFRLFLCFGLEPRISFMKTLEMPAWRLRP